MQILRYIVLLWVLLPSTLPAIESEEHRLKEFFEQEWEWRMKESPLEATTIGDLRYNDRLDDFSIEATRQRQQHKLEVLKKLQTFDRSKLSDSEKLNYDLYLRTTKIEVEGHQFPDDLMPITQLDGIHQNAPQMAKDFPFHNTKHYDDYLNRLNQLPHAIDQIIDRLKLGLAKKITPSKITLRDVADQIKAQIVQSPEDSAFYEPFMKFPESVAKSEQTRLQQAGRDAIKDTVIPAFQKFYDFWTREYYPNTLETVGLSAFPNGRAWYAYLAKYYTTTELTPEQIHEIGLREVKRIREEMDKIIRESGFKGSFDEWMKFLRTDPGFFYTRPQDLLTGYRDICKRIDAELPRLFGKLPKLTYGVREIPAFSAPSQTTAYYEEGSLKAGRPGWYYANTYKLETRPKWEMEALSIHEAVPGHHFQITLAQEMTNVPKFRNFLSYTAFVEGWALYTESIGAELGLYRDPYSKFGQLTYEMWRAVRLVVDTGLHFLNWDRQKAIEYFKANAPKQEHDIIVEIDRYIVMPGQALAYKIGELKIKELRKYSADQLGEKFDIREFHDRVLENGALPLSILEQQIHNYVTEKKKY